MSGETPQKIDRYEIKGLIGQGGMATVYRAHDPRFEREVAIKLMPKAFLYEPDFRTRFIREAKTIALLEHPNIVPVYDFGEDQGQPYLVMRLMNGGSLSDKLENGPLPMAEVLKIMERIGSALDEAHRRGIVHRDLKPANILFDQYGNAYLGDFGIVRLAQGGGTSLTGTGTIGTPGYMSPEQIQGQELDGRADIYALGVMLFEMLTGERPYKADSAPMMIVKQMTESIPKLQTINPNLPRSYDAVLDRATAKNRDTRPQTARELAQMLAAAMADPNYIPPLTGNGPVGGTQKLSPPRGTVSRPAPAGDSTEVMTDTRSRHPAPAPGVAPVITPAPAASGRRWPIYLGVAIILILLAVVAALLLNQPEDPGTTVVVITTTAEPTATPDAAATGTALALLNAPTATELPPTPTDTATPEPTPTVEPSPTTITATVILTTTQAAALFTSFEDGEQMCIFLEVGDTITEVIGRSENSNWLLVEVEDTRGWVTARFFDITGVVASLPVSAYVANVPAGCTSGGATTTATTTSSSTGGTAFYNISGASTSSLGNGTWKVDFTVRVPTGGSYQFRVSDYAITAVRQGTTGSQDNYVVSVSGISCSGALIADLIVLRDGQSLEVVDELTGGDETLFISSPSNC